MEREAENLTHVRGPRPRAGTAQLDGCPLPGFSLMGFFGAGEAQVAPPACACRRDEGVGSGGEVKGHDSPLPSPPDVLEAVSARTEGDSELPLGSTPDPREKPRFWLRLLKVDDINTCFSCGRE